MMTTTTTLRALAVAIGQKYEFFGGGLAARMEAEKLVAALKAQLADAESGAGGNDGGWRARIWT
eukprot:SAG31_NODE_424_length_15826_cov_4.954664_7_plen_64_part_00